MATSDHTRKKQFRPSISSYFTKQPGSHEHVTSPPLPLETQASLLNVGMRVRKSVPEGYKTHKTILQQQGQPTSGMTMSQPVLQRWNSRELQPFSGIHKTGGYAQQTDAWCSSTLDLSSTVHFDHWSSSAPALLSKSSFDSTPSLTTSQGTMSTTGSFNCDDISRKRGYEEEIEESMDNFFDEMDREEEIAARRIAQPKSYNRRQRMLQILDNPGDFPEAHFLQPDADSDMNSEYT